MRYDYNIVQECFIREDGLGKKYPLNITEARRIMTLLELGNSIPEIRNKIQFHSNKVSESTIKNFIAQVKKGNISLEGDYPAPNEVMFELTLSERVDRLEEAIDEIKEQLNAPCTCKTEESRWKRWLKM